MGSLEPVRRVERGELLSPGGDTWSAPPVRREEWSPVEEPWGGNQMRNWMLTTEARILRMERGMFPAGNRELQVPSTQGEHCSVTGTGEHTDRPDPSTQWSSLSSRVKHFPSRMRPRAYTQDRNMYLSSTPKKMSFFPAFYKGFYRK